MSRFMWSRHGDAASMYILVLLLRRLSILNNVRPESYSYYGLLVYARMMKDYDYPRS